MLLPENYVPQELWMAHVIISIAMFSVLIIAWLSMLIIWIPKYWEDAENKLAARKKVIEAWTFFGFALFFGATGIFAVTVFMVLATIWTVGLIIGGLIFLIVQSIKIIFG